MIDLDKTIIEFKKRLIADGKSVYECNPEIAELISELRSLRLQLKEAEEALDAYKIPGEITGRAARAYFEKKAKDPIQKSDVDK